jgi:transposase-like protein
MEEGARKRRRITPEEKLEIFCEVQKGNITKAEVMRRHGIHSAELARIEKRGREGALTALKEDRRKKPDPEKDALEREVARLKEALTEQSVEVTLLRKKVNGV